MSPGSGAWCRADGSSRCAFTRSTIAIQGSGARSIREFFNWPGFMSMKPHLHVDAFVRQIARNAVGDPSGIRRHNAFYDEYLAVTDLTAEFYLSTLDRIFRDREIARNVFAIDGQPVDLGAIHANSRPRRRGRARRYFAAWPMCGCP